MSTSPQASCSAGRQRQPARSARSAPAAKGRILGVGRCPFSRSHADAFPAAYFALFHAPGAIMILAGVPGLVDAFARFALQGLGYDADWIRELAATKGAWANIPPKSNRSDPICFSPYLCRARNRVEHFFNKIKHCRRVATRYDKLAANYLAFVQP